MLTALKTALLTTGIPFTEAAWTTANGDEYGTFYASGQKALGTDTDSGAEIMLEGYVDLYTKTNTLTGKGSVETVLRNLGIWWELESIQFESDTGLTHYEWRWRDTNGSV